MLPLWTASEVVFHKGCRLRRYTALIGATILTDAAILTAVVVSYGGLRLGGTALTALVLFRSYRDLEIHISLFPLFSPAPLSLFPSSGD